MHQQSPYVRSRGYDFAMARVERTYFGRGIYSVSEAARLLRLPASTVRRWVAGYTFTYRGAPRFSEPLIRGELGSRDGFVELSFLDVVELLFIKNFHERGVSLPVIRKTARAAAELLGRDHPFCDQRFKTDGSTIFAMLLRNANLAEAASSQADWRLIDLRTGQHELATIVMPFLQHFEYDLQTDLVRQWWPLGKRRRVVVDPAINFGAPIVPKFGVSTRLLADAVKRGRSVEQLAAWYGVPTPAVRDAVEFEASLATAA